MISTIRSNRMFYVDWLRVLAFGVLITENCAEVFAGHHWWINNTETNQTIADILIFFRQWRMPLLFMISGLAVSMILQKKSILEFLDDRFVRIFVPLISGMLLVIPPMIFFIRLAEGNTISVQNFYLHMLDFRWFPRGNIHWLHLWYLAFILIFSISILPVIKFLKYEKVKAVIDEVSLFLTKPIVLFSSVLIFHFPYFISHIFIPNSDLSSLIYYFPYFLFGILFFTNKQISEAIVRYRNTALFGGIIFSFILYCSVWLKHGIFSASIAPGLQIFFQEPMRLWILSLNQWFWVIALTGYASRTLNFGNTFLTYANRIVYPFYILHQTLIIILAYYIIPLDASITTKFLLLLTGTSLIVLTLYELILKKFLLFRLMFGIKTNFSLINVFPKSAGYLKKWVHSTVDVSGRSLN